MERLAGQVFFVPSYMLGFQCQMCDECCIGWKIPVEKRIYKEIKYLFMTKKIPLGRFEDFFQKEPRPIFGRDFDYGFLKLSDNGKCKFLEGNLCYIHKNVGPEYLPGVCKSFPRIIVSTRRGLEFSFSPGCKYAAQTFLSKSKAKVVVNPPDFSFIPGSIVNFFFNQKYFSKNVITKNYYTLEEHFIEIVQNRLWTIEERLIFLGLTINRALKLSQDDSYKEELEELITENKDIMAGSEFTEEVKKLGLNMDYHLKALQSFLNAELYKDCAAPEVIENINRCANRILSGGLNENIAAYRKMYHFHLRPAAGDVAHVFENYLVNFVLRKMFIIYPLEDAFYIMAFFYIIIRVLTLFLASEKKELVGEDDVVQAIYLIEKSLGHNRAYDEALIQLKKQKKTDIVYATGLIRI